MGTCGTDPLGNPQAVGYLRNTDADPSLLRLKVVSLIRKYHNHKLQTNPRHREEEPRNNHKTPGRQAK